MSRTILPLPVRRLRIKQYRRFPVRRLTVAAKINRKSVLYVEDNIEPMAGTNIIPGLRF